MTILEILQCAQINLVENKGQLPHAIGAQQLSNAISLLEKNYPPDFDTDDLESITAAPIYKEYSDE